MLRLRATLVTVTALRRGCGGWSEQGGVDLALPPAPTRSCPSSAKPEPARAAEPASFLEPCEMVEPEAAGLRPVVPGTAERTEAGPEPAGGALQAWSQLRGRSQRS